MKDVIYDVEEMPKAGILFGLSFQHLFAMFGATVLVPILVGIDPSVALLSSGLGTLAHLSVTKFKIPAYMGSSFAYIAAMQMLMKTDGIGAVAQGAITACFLWSFSLRPIGASIIPRSFGKLPCTIAKYFLSDFFAFNSSAKA